MNRFNNIVYILNNHTNENSPSLVHAVKLAKANQSDLTVLKILPDMSMVKFSKITGIDEKEIKEKIVAQENDKLQYLVTSMEVEINAKAELRTGKRYLEIIRAVQANDYDLVIKEVDNVDWRKRFLGSDDMHLLRKCPCPVWIMKKNEKPEYKNIMTAIDFDDDLEVGEYSYNDELNQKILDLSISLSLSHFKLFMW